MYKYWKSAALSGLFLASFPTKAVEIRAYDPARHDRFVNFPSNLAANATFYLGGEDWSGFGWNTQDTRKHFTLISPKHFVGAAHFRPGVGQQVRFRNRDGVIKSYTIAARHSILNDQDPAVASDLFVGELNAPIPEGDKVSIVPIYNLATEAEYAGTEIVVSGRASRGAKGTIASVANFGGESGSVAETRGFSFTYSDPGFGDDDGYAVDGDSGGPSAVLTDEGFALVGTHSAVLTTSLLFSTTYTTFDALVPHYLDRIDAVLADDGYHATRFNETSPDLSLAVVESGDPVLSSEGVSYTLTISNSAAGEVAHNLRLDLSCDAGATFASASGASGANWIVENGGTTLRALKGGLESDATSSVVVVLNLPDNPTGAVTFSANLTADGSSEVLQSESTDVAQSYQSWAAGLGASGPQDDPDGDGLSNELEFALGRNGALAEEESTLGVTLTGADIVLSFSERAFADFLGVGVVLQASTNLSDWADVEATPMSLEGNLYQNSEAELTRPQLLREFFRLKATISPAPVF